MTDRKSTPRRAARGRGTVAKRPSGRWQARWTAPDGGRVTRTFPTQRDATAWLAAQETDAGRGAWARPGQETVGSVLDRWTEALPLSPRKPSTVAEYRRDARIIAERIGHVSLSKLTPGHVRRGLILPLLADGRSRRYIRRIMVTLRHALAEARGDGLLATDPLDDPGLRGLVRDDRDAARPERRVLSDAEAARLVEAARAVGPEAFAAVGVAVAAGLRVGEILGLRGRDLGSGSVTVAQAVYGGRIGTPKTRAGERTVRLLPSGART